MITATLSDFDINDRLVIIGPECMGSINMMLRDSMLNNVFKYSPKYL